MQSTKIAAVVLFSAWALVSIYWPRANTPTGAQQGGQDLLAYRYIVERVHGGENYYLAAGEELRAGGYACSSVFNWRLPTSAWLLAAFPSPRWAQALLVLLALIVLALAYSSACDQGGVVRAGVLVLLMAGTFLWCIDGDAFFAQELWAGVLIALSVFAYQHKKLLPLAVGAGLAALFLRELAMPYVLVALALAVRERRWRETAAWCAGVAVFFAFFAWHAWQVRQSLTGTEFAESQGWIQFGGPAFVIRTCQMNAWLFNLPAWVAVIYLAAALLGLAGCRHRQSLLAGATVCIYLAAFLIVGKPFNGYWGLLYVPLLPIGVVALPHTLRSWKILQYQFPGSHGSMKV